MHFKEQNHKHHGHVHGHGHCGCHCEPKIGILMSMFGTTILEAQSGYDALLSAASERFPGIPIFKAYTADKVRRKMKRLDREALSVSQALMDMYDDGFTHVAVQSVHTIPGVEYDWTCQQARALEHPRKGLKKITIGKPLLTEKMLAHVAAKTAAYIPSSVKEDEAVVLVGHGAYHVSQIYYHAFQSSLQAFSPDWFVGTLMGKGLGIDSVLKKLSNHAVRTVHLIPFMGVPGHHFMVDMAGPQEDSWSSILMKQGYECVCHKLGTAGSAAFIPIWLHNLHKALLHLGKDVTNEIPPLPHHHGCHASHADASHPAAGHGSHGTHDGA